MKIEIPPQLADELAQMARERGLSPDFVVNDALRQLIEDWEDYRDALEVLKNPGRTYSREEMERELGL